MKFFIISTFIYFIMNSYAINDNDIITLNLNNTINLNSEINEDIISKIIYDLSIIDTDINKNIYLYINTNGGNVKYGNNLIDSILFNSKRYNLICIANYAASMGMAILQSCSKRYATVHSILMQHQISLKINDQQNRVKNYINYINNLENEFIELQAKRIGISYDEFKNKIRDDWWITGYQALKENIIDKLVNVGCNPDFVKQTYKKEEYKPSYKIISIYSKCPLVTKPINITYEMISK